MRIVIAAALIVTAAPLAAQNAGMSAGEFLAKAEALEKKGAMALFSSDAGKLKQEIRSSGEALRAQQVADRKAGRRSAYCLPEKAQMNSAELLAHLRSIPVAAQRSMSFRSAFAMLVKKKYPCT